MVGSDRTRRVLLVAVAVAALLGASTLLVAALETTASVPDASATYLLAVIATAAAFGTAAAVGAAVGAFFLYDYLFIEPTGTLTVRDPGEWLNLLLLLVVGVVVARLAGALRDRAEAAGVREREARALFAVSRALATRSDTLAVLEEIAGILRRETGALRAWVVLKGAARGERLVADSEPGPRPVTPPRQAVLRRMPGEAPAEWIRLHQPTPLRRPAGAVPSTTASGHPDDSSGAADASFRAIGSSPSDGGLAAFKVVIEAAGQERGSIWLLQPRRAGEPDRSATRLLSAAADQIGQVVEQDRLADEARSAELARQSDALKSALLESVSHDLRTPLASIRIAAGTLLDPAVRLSDEDRAATASAIDREAEYLNRLVTNLLDLSRIEAGALRADLEAFDVADMVNRTLDRIRPRLAGRDIDLRVSDDLPPVMVDPVFIDQVLTNLLENEVKYLPLGKRVSIHAAVLGESLRLTVEDDGPGVPADALEHLFEKFYRVRRRGDPSRPGTGIGLAVVRGLVEAMAGTVAARPSELGGLAVDVVVPLAPTPGDDDAELMTEAGQ